MIRTPRKRLHNYQHWWKHIEASCQAQCLVRRKLSWRSSVTTPSASHNEVQAGRSAREDQLEASSEPRLRIATRTVHTALQTPLYIDITRKTSGESSSDTIGEGGIAALRARLPVGLTFTYRDNQVLRLAEQGPGNRNRDSSVPQSVSTDTIEADRPRVAQDGPRFGVPEEDPGLRLFPADAAALRLKAGQTGIL